MTENKYTSTRIIDGKPRIVIVDETGKIVNRSPSKDELKGLEKEIVKDSRRHKEYTKDHLLNELKRFEKEEGRIPKEKDLSNNLGYPSIQSYKNYFGSLNKALKLIGMDLDTRVVQGCLKTNIEKGRYAEIMVIDHFRRHPIDLAGENRKSSCDGICPNGNTYDVKSSKLYKDSLRSYYDFHTNNKYKEEIEIYYLLGFNEDYSRLEYIWRLPGEIVERNRFIVELNNWSRGYTIDSIKEYDITDKFKELIKY